MDVIASGVEMLPRRCASREVIIAADPAAWLGLVEGRANLVTELRANRLRYYDSNQKGFLRFDALHAAATCSG
jgi:hypothetical protein